MSRAFAYSPDYRLWLEKSNGQTWSLRSLHNLQASLFVRDGVGQMSITLADPNGKIRDDAQPHAMNKIQLQLKNQYGQWATAWTGYVDEVHRTFDGQQGEQVQLTCTSPYKLFEITRLTPSQVASLAVAYMTNITGSAVLKYACQACGFPLTKDSSGKPWVSFGIDVDSGSGIQTSISTASFTNPDNQTWSAVIQSLLSNSGVESFHDETGRLYWRKPAYLDVPSNPRAIEPYDIIGSDFFESDEGVVTRVEVRWGVMPFHQNAAFWQAPAGMVTHLRQRALVVYAPWLQNQAAASWLAQMLGQQLSSGILQAQVTIPADPYYTIGTTVKVALPNNPYLVQGLLSAPPPKRGTDYALYYVSSISYQLEWGGQWTMTLGLSYGRNANNNFPYVGNTAYPILSDRQGVPYNTTITTFSFDPNFPARISTPFTLVSQTGLDSKTVTSSSLPAGSIIVLNAASSGTQSSSTGIGSPVGPSPNGEYTVKAAPAGQAPNVLGIAPGTWVQGTPNVYVSFRADGQNDAQTQSDGAGGAFDLGAPGDANTGTNSGTGSPPDIGPISGHSLAARAFNLALTFADQDGQSHYVLAGTGQKGGDGKRIFDCSGLVTWCYAACGYQWRGTTQYDSNGDGGIVWFQNALDQYNWFSNNHGGVAISVDQAQPGDLLFCSHTGDPSGIGHVGFCSAAGGTSNGHIFAACNPTQGIRDWTIASQTVPVNFAISMRNVVVGG